MPAPQVISCSRRTDVPRCYPGWLELALASGSVSFQSPRGSVRRVSLAPEDVHSLVLWSKDYRPLLRRRPLVKMLLGLNCYFHFTITGLGQSVLEPEIPAWEDALTTLERLAGLFGEERVNWRFDPVVHWRDGSGSHSNLPLFARIAERVVATGVTTCTFSLVQPYRKSGRRARKAGLELREPRPEADVAVAAKLARLSAARGIRLSSCAAPEWQEVKGISRGRCVDAGLLGALRPDGLRGSQAKDSAQRQNCGCSRSVDIGSYSQRCGAAQCVYCYAS